jgi:RHS repeat-associated protein
MGSLSYACDDLNRLAQAIANKSFTSSSCQLPSGATGTQELTTYVGESSGSTSNRIATITPAGQTTAITVQYDGFATAAPGPGNITSDGVNTYLYDAEDRLCAVHGVDGMVGYQYDAEGNRIGKGSITSMSCDITANGYQPQSDYILDQAGDQVTEMAVDATGTEVWQHTNVWADGQLITTFDTTGQHFYFNDALGSRRFQTDASGVIEQTCQSLPFGDNLNCSLSTTAPTEHNFTGKERDTESGLDYFGARYYTSSFGRWISPDWSSQPDEVPYSVFADPQSLNLYQFVRNNPLSNRDADGHDCPPDCHNPWFYFTGAVGEALNIVPGTINLAPEAFNHVSAKVGGPTMPKLDLIQPDDRTDPQAGAYWANMGLLGFALVAPIVEPLMPEAPARVPQGPLVEEKYWMEKEAPTQVTPGTRQTTEMKPSSRSRGEVYERTTHHDEYGRSTGQTHDTHHGEPSTHPKRHHHLRNPKNGHETGPQSGVHPDYHKMII